MAILSGKCHMLHRFSDFDFDDWSICQLNKYEQHTGRVWFDVWLAVIIQDVWLRIYLDQQPRRLSHIPREEFQAP